MILSARRLAVIYEWCIQERITAAGYVDPGLLCGSASSSFVSVCCLSAIKHNSWSYTLLLLVFHALIRSLPARFGPYGDATVTLLRLPSFLLAII